MYILAKFNTSFFKVLKTNFEFNTFNTTWEPWLG